MNIARGTTDPEIDSDTWIKFSNNIAPLALVAYLAPLALVQIWSPDGATCISSIQMASLVLVANMATRWHHLN